jgi:hypothetical protein
VNRAGSNIHFVTPTYKPVGGVVKIFDYVSHSLAMGMSVTIWCNEPVAEELPLFRLPGFEGLVANPGVEFRESTKVAPGIDDFVFFSWPSHWREVALRLPSGFAHERLIHIIQNIRHANPQFIDGYALRLLSRPMSRILINDVVKRAVAPYLNRSCPSCVIPLGHRTEFFARHRRGGFMSPLRVGYTTWKSDLGDVIREQLDGGAFEFRAIRGTADWSELRELYQWADVFLGTPDREEGFYLPGLEAMAAGAVLIIPDA